MRWAASAVLTEPSLLKVSNSQWYYRSVRSGECNSRRNSWAGPGNGGVRTTIAYAPLYEH